MQKQSPACISKPIMTCHPYKTHLRAISCGLAGQNPVHLKMQRKDDQTKRHAQVWRHLKIQFNQATASGFLKILQVSSQSVIEH